MESIGEETGDVAERYNHMSQGQIEFEEQLESRRECLQEEDNQGKESVSRPATAKQGKPLPFIDLFLNPKRAEEKEELLIRAQKEDAGTDHTEVKFC